MNPNRWRVIALFSFLALLVSCQKPSTPQPAVEPVQIETSQTTSEPEAPAKTPKVKNVILMIGDGMGLQQISLATFYRQLKHPNKPQLALEKLMGSKSMGMMRTNSVGDIVTDSAAAATSLSCGIKTLNQIVGMDEKGFPCETILEKATKLGKSTGLVTTSRLTHATPAGFAAHQIYRKMENEIADDIIEKQDVNIMLSGGIRYFIPQYRDEAAKTPMKASDLTECAGLDSSINGKSKRKDQKNHIETAKSKGYTFVCDREQLKNVPLQADTKLLGLFSSSVFPMIQERNAIASLPTLTEMTQVALEALSQNPKGFFLMVEGALIDYAGHDNDAGSMLQETLDFDQSIQVVMDFVDKNPDTLLIVTADHETGGFGFAYGRRINLEKDLPSGLRYKKPYDFASIDKFDYLDSQKKSFRAMLKPIEKKLYPKDPAKAPADYGMDAAAKELVEVVQANSQFKLTEAQAKEVLTRKPGKKDAEPKDFSEFYVHKSIHPNMLGRALANQSHTVWAAGTHTSTPVPVMAYGPVEESIKVQGFIDNTQIPQIIEAAWQETVTQKAANNSP